MFFFCRFRGPSRSTLFPYTTLFRSMLTGELVRADEALRIGLANRVYPAAEVHARTHELAAAIAQGPPLVHRAVKRADRKSTRLNSSHANISYAVFCLKKKKMQVRKH